jgi:voltage-gated potassium channel
MFVPLKQSARNRVGNLKTEKKAASMWWLFFITLSEVNLRNKIFTVIFGTDTRAGKSFDVVLLWMIILSVTVVVFESVSTLRHAYGNIFTGCEWFFTIAFSIEYLLRVYSSPKPWKYITSFFGIVDLLAILPTFMGLIFDQATFLLTIRALRLLRMFRVFKLGRYVKEAAILVRALQLSLHKIIVFFGAVLTLVLILGSLLYLIEGEENGFNSIPQSIYWAIVTITTVGYGDLAPVTVMGKILASVAMLTGYSIIAVPTGIISVEIGKAVKSERDTLQVLCKNCGHKQHDADACFCKICGSML